MEITTKQQVDQVTLHFGLDAFELNNAPICDCRQRCVFTIKQTTCTETLPLSLDRKMISSSIIIRTIIMTRINEQIID